MGSTGHDLGVKRVTSKGPHSNTDHNSDINAFRYPVNRKMHEHNNTYVKCSKILNTSNTVLIKSLVTRTGIHKMLIRIANREDFDQTDSWSGSALFV